MSNTLDLTGTDAAHGLEKLQQQFASVAPGEAFELVVSGDAGSLLRGMQEKHWGAFDWAPLAATSGAATFWVKKLANPLKTRQIGEFMTGDHRRCDSVFVNLEQEATAGNKETTSRYFGQFELGMLHHFDMEEKVFFPAFENRTGMTRGPTTVMRMEHDQMRGILKQMRQSLEGGDTGGVARACTTLLMVMQQHNIKEEQMLYAMGDMHLGSDGDTLTRQMQALQ
ncbi:MAG: hemerythrin domain-containing protein [Magnetococcus sp. DMHC-1]|nr:hemerythrin domain-containing protein [Magnetococcales bacterium]